MNNRDPFNLRNFKPPNFVTVGANLAARSANNLRVQLEESVKQLPDAGQALESLRSQAVAEMSSYSVSRSVDHRSDRTENAEWQPRRTHNTANGNANGNGAGNGVGEKLNGMFRSGAGDEGLPMYKDKPYNYSKSSKRLPLYRRRPVLAVIGVVLLGVLYWTGIFSGSSSKEPSKGSGSTLGAFSKSKGPKDWNQRAEKVKEAFKISWSAYEESAWGYDQFHPISQRGTQMVPNGMGWIIVDALDTMMIMNLTTQVSHAREWISTTLSYDQDHDVNTFETTIRMLGGLLSAHYLSTEFPELAPIPVAEGSTAEDLYLEKATDLADRLLGAYRSNSGVPYASVNLHSSEGIRSHDDGGASSTAEAATLQLEMKYLAKLTGETHYWEAAEHVIKVIDDNGAKDGLVPIFIYAETGAFRGNNIRLGSRGDSYYEYLIKQYLQTSEQEPIYLDMWDESIRGVRKHLITYSEKAHLTILAERPNGLEGQISPKMDHLVCFMPGTIALGATGGRTLSEAKKLSSWGKKQEEDMELAKQLMKTCWGMYKVTATGLAAEITHFKIPVEVDVKDKVPSSPDELSDDPDAPWRQDYDIHIADWHNLQRPETVESLFYMWRITGDERYRDWGWEMFESFMNHTIIPSGAGFSSLSHVGTIPPPTRDNMESFWLAETLKYFYLLFGPNDVLPLDKVIFNTEAHAFPKFELGKLFSTGWKRLPRDAQGNVERPSVPASTTVAQVTEVVEVTKTVELGATEGVA